jgi:hypothetical protein
MSKDAKPIIMSVNDNEKEEEKGMIECFSEGLSQRWSICIFFGGVPVCFFPVS